LSAPDSVFDAMAEQYDGHFTHTAIGALMRQAVWARLAARFTSGARVLEMNCGTGEDALWLSKRGVSVLATDVSGRMLEVAAKKLAAAPTSVRLERLAWEQLAGLEEGNFDGVLSNFGGLNCVADLDAAAASLAGKIKPKGYAVLCIMGPWVPWEWAWFLLQGQPGKALRRLRPKPWRGVMIRYPTIGELRRAFGPYFRLRRIAAIGALLPPPYAEVRLARSPRLLAALSSLERRLETLWPLTRLADHYLAEFERR
jgi:SAM-dependent methyltransferase